jgi:hypothetical protein
VESFGEFRRIGMVKLAIISIVLIKVLVAG